jgi:hypothetical protein
MEWDGSGTRKSCRHTNSGVSLVLACVDGLTCRRVLAETQVIEYAAGDTWRNIQHGLDRMQLVTLATAEGQVAQRSATTADQKASPLKLSEPLRFFDFTIETGTTG